MNLIHFLIVLGGAFPLLLERILPICLVTKKGLVCASINKIKKHAENPRAIMAILQKSLPALFPLFLRIDGRVLDPVVGCVLKLVRDLDAVELKRIIYTKDVLHYIQSGEARASLPSETFTSCRQPGFLISVRILELYVEELKGKFPVKQPEHVLQFPSTILDFSTYLFKPGEFWNALEIRTKKVESDLLVLMKKFIKEKPEKKKGKKKNRR